MILEADEPQDKYTVLYAAGLVNDEWIKELNNRSRLAPYWFLDQKVAMQNSRKQIWLEDPGTASVLMVAKTFNSNVMAPDKLGKVYLRRPSIILVQMTANGQPVRDDLKGAKITHIAEVKPPVDIDAL